MGSRFLTLILILFVLTGFTFAQDNEAEEKLREVMEKAKAAREAAEKKKAEEAEKYKTLSEVEKIRVDIKKTEAAIDEIVSQYEKLSKVLEELREQKDLGNSDVQD